MSKLKVEKCGVQQPISIRNLFSDTSRIRESVMDIWIREMLYQDPTGTRCAGRILRRKVGARIYRYQVQEASAHTAFGFSEESIHEDIEQNGIVVVFKQRTRDGKLFDYWVWQWGKPADGTISVLRRKVNGQALSKTGIGVSKTNERVVVSLNPHTAVCDGTISWEG